jgi:hypothetical protein
VAEVPPEVDALLAPIGDPRGQTLSAVQHARRHDRADAAVRAVAAYAAAVRDDVDAIDIGAPLDTLAAGQVHHGGNVNYPRPDAPDTLSLFWFGWVAPANMGPYDLWFETTEPPFTPLMLTDLEGWYDASNASTLTLASGAVSGWADLSGKGRHASQPTAAARPGTGTLNGKTVLTFDGGDFLTTAGLHTGQARTTYAVVVNTVNDATRRTIMEAVPDNSSGSFAQMLMEVNASDRYSFWTYDTVNRSATAPAAIGAKVGIRRVQGSDSLRLYVTNPNDPVTVALTGPIRDNTVLTGINIGANRTSAANFWKGHIAEIIDCSTAHDLETRTKVVAYLTQKWSL